MPNVVGGTLNVVTHALPELPQEKKEGRKKRRKRGESAFFFSGQVMQCMGGHILCAYYHVGHK